MAITGVHLKVIKDCIDLLRKDIVDRDIDLLELSYPDLLASPMEIEAFLGQGTIDGLIPRADSDKIIAWHSRNDLSCIYDTHDVWGQLGIAPTTIDIAQNRADEVFLDLNFPISQDFVEKFDFVIDPGTLEHCFNVGQAFLNTCSTLRKGGVLFQISPFNVSNHGFWSFSPTIYGDFCEDNGFELLQLMLNFQQTQLVPIEPFMRYTDIPENCWMISVIQRIEVQDLIFPVQRKYR